MLVWIECCTLHIGAWWKVVVLVARHIPTIIDNSDIGTVGRLQPQARLDRLTQMELEDKVAINLPSRTLLDRQSASAHWTVCDMKLVL